MKKLLLAACAALGLVAAAYGQSYPINSPVYIPTAVLGPTLIPAGQGSSFVFQTNGQGTMYLRIAGAPSGLASTVQVSEARAATTVAATVTISNASPGVISWTNHGLSINQPVVFATTGALPTGLTAGTTYYVIAAGYTANAFEVATTPGGTAINTSSAGSGTQTATTTSVEWTNSGIAAVGGVQQASITATGLYKLNVSGIAQVRLNVSALTSGVTYVTQSAGQGDELVRTAPFLRASYSASALIATGATNHFLVLAGSATKTVRVTHAECSGKATASINVNITAEVDSTADTGDAGTAVTATPHDSNNPAATATVLSHTTSPTPGTLVGLVRAGAMNVVVATESATDFPSPNVLSWDFGNRPGAQEVVLRGVAQSFSLNTSAAFGTGAAVGCAVEFTEE